MSKRPVVLLDVDGVVNAVPWGDKKVHDGFNDFCQTICAGFRITYSPKMGERLAALDADIVWLTTWEQDDMANAWIAPLFGWDPLPILHASDEWYRPGWWKSSILEKFIRNDPRPFVWLDDDLSSEERRGGIDWVKDVNVPYLLISPQTANGLQPEHLDRVEEFIDEVSR
jgi:hypothetical protein